MTMRRRVGLQILVAATGSLAVATPWSAAAATASVAIKEGPPGCSSPSYCYTPATVTVFPGDTVTWSNGSDAPHTVTRCTPSACAGNGPGTGPDDGPASGTVAANGSYSFTFHGPGSYLYYCTVHGYAVMHGTVTVAAAVGSPSSQPLPGASATPSPSGGTSPATTPATGAALLLTTGLVLIGAGSGAVGAAVWRRRRRQ